MGVGIKWGYMICVHWVGVGDMCRYGVLVLYVGDAGGCM